MERLTAKEIEGLLHSQVKEEQFILEPKLAYEMSRIDDLLGRYHRLYFLALSLITLASIGVGTLIWIVWRTIPDYASRPTAIVIAVWAGIGVAAPLYFFASAIWNRRKVYKVERQAFEFEQAIFKELLDQMKGDDRAHLK